MKNVLFVFLIAAGVRFRGKYLKHLFSGFFLAPFRRAILMTEACKVQQYPYSVDQPIQDLDWEVFLRETAQHIVQEQTPKKLLEVRARLYELLTHCIPADVIFV